MSDKLFDVMPFRILTIVDCFTKEALATAARTNFRAYRSLMNWTTLRVYEENPGAFALLTVPSLLVGYLTNGPI